MREERIVRKPTRAQRAALQILMDEGGLWSHDERVCEEMRRILATKEWAVWRNRRDESRGKIYAFYTITQAGVAVTMA